MFENMKNKFKPSNTDRSLSLYCSQGEYAGISFPVTPDEPISIGKNPEQSNIVLSDGGVSRLHCTITYSGSEDQYIVTDHSSNGVYLENGSRLVKETPTRLACNSSIFFGKETQVFELNREENVNQQTELVASTPIILPKKKSARKAPAPQEHIPAPYEQNGLTCHATPKCTHCGYVGEWKLESLLLPHHIIIFLIFLFFWGAGLIYLIVILIIRMRPDSRAKICPHCKARNLWTFYY